MSVYPKFKTKEAVWNKFNINTYGEEQKAPIKSTIKPKKSVIRFSEKKRLDALKGILGACRPLLRDLPVKEICARSGLSTTTVYHLMASKVSLNMRYGTVQRFACAAGLEIVWQNSEFDLKLVD